MRVLDGPLAQVRGLRPEATDYTGSAKHLQAVWIAMRANLRSVLEHVTLDDVIAGRLPEIWSDLAPATSLESAS
jgi:DNA-binding IscR family transcriptional regulator